MKKFLFFLFKNKKDNKLKKSYYIFLIFFLVFSFSFFRIQEVNAQIVNDPTSFAQRAAQWIKEAFQSKLGKAIQKAGSIAFNRTLQSSLNKIAYDAANFIGSGDVGQKELYRTENIKSYIGRIGDEAGGQFLETFVRNLDTSNATSSDISCEKRLENCLTSCYQQAHGKDPDDKESLMFFRDGLAGGYIGVSGQGIFNAQACVKQCELGNTNCANTAGKGFTKDQGRGNDLNSFNVCQPSSIEVKLKISLGLVEQNRSTGPNCTATEAISNWGDDIQKKLASIHDAEFLKNVENIFDPRANDLGIYFLARTDMSQTMKAEQDIKLLEDTNTGGWIDVRNIAGEIKGVPGAARNAEADARAIRIANFGKTTGDIFEDAANLFLNQLAISAYNNLIRTLTDKKADAGPSLADPASDPNFNLGESKMLEKTRRLIEVNFGTKTDFSILSELAVCVEPGNPGPDNCVINDRFMTAIIEQKTLAEAVKEGYLDKNWRFEKDVFVSAYNNHFSLRNIKILRKYRILPLSWELAVQRIFEFENQGKVRFANLGDLMSCFRNDDEFEDFSSGFETSDTTWCQGLIDPNWVLKAPLNYCAKEGSGAYIQNIMITPGQVGLDGSSSLSKLMVTRGTNYCADTQSCIQENKDGGCGAYGYCTEEKRIWGFGSDDSSSCSPINNTCQTFIKVDSGETVSYLENTIDYGGCTADSAGCRRYSLSGIYNSNGSISWNFSKNLFFNKNLVACNLQNEGCSELMRVKPSCGFNLVVDPNFNNLRVGQIAEEAINTDPLEIKGVGQLTGVVKNLGPWIIRADSTAITSVIETENSNVSDYVSGNSRAIQLRANQRISLVSSAKVFPKDLQILANQIYTLSADVFLFNGNQVEVILNTGNNESKQIISEKGYWQRVSLSLNSSSGFYVPSFSFSGSGGPVEFYVKNIKFELGAWATSYNNYGTHISKSNQSQSAKINQKLLPDYLASTCYADVSLASKDYNLIANPPAICSNYTRRCNYGDVGCELFSSVYNNFSVPAQVSSSDYCPGECLGYDVYIAKETYFNSKESQNLIPSLAKKCSQATVGCSEFTNLDEISRGGEGKEYYSELRQCIKPNSTQCASFYTWESSAGGYEIKTYNLQKDSSENPLINYGDTLSADCSDIFALPISDPRYNPDCREFRNTAGQVSYRLISRVITCSDNCFSYRLSETNIHPTIKTKAECEASSEATSWNDQSLVCNVCLNGGIWNSDHNACVYQAIPGEGKVCRAEQVGCREYNGNQGDNIRVIATYNFENGLNSWYSNCSDGISTSPIANSQSGNSLFYNSSATSCDAENIGKSVIERLVAGDNQIAKIRLGDKINPNKAYSLRFLARSFQNNSLKIYFESESGEKYFFGSVEDISRDSLIPVKGANEWGIYMVNLENVPKSLGFNGTLNISASHDFYLDDLILTEISNRYYFVKKSITIPDVCYYDNSYPQRKYQGMDYNLGCSQYRDRDGALHNLHNFNKLCSNSAVGCEQMIFTNNYNSPYQGIWNDDNENGRCDLNEKECFTVEADTVIYAIYDKTKNCLSSDLGCSRLGEALGSGVNMSWSDVFKLNNPNNYSRTLCAEDDLGCEVYSYANSSGLNYFRNPANNLCVYRASKDSNILNKAWYKVPVKRCDLNDDGLINGLEGDTLICNQNSDCVRGSCIIDNNDYACSISYLKTIGYGGLGGNVPVPDKATALCEPAQSGCSEYIDPLSSFNPNLVKNPDYSNEGEAWGEGDFNNIKIRPEQQIINLERNKLYSFRAFNKTKNSVASGVRLEFIGDIRILGEENIDGTKKLTKSNEFGEVTKNLTIHEDNYPFIIFNSLNNYSALLTSDKNSVIEIRELVVSYIDKDSVDSRSCEQVDFDNGCILFNERSVAGDSGLSTNIYNAFATTAKQAPVTKYGPYSANKLLKVRPDRVCATWLSCASYVIGSDGKNICTSLAECNSLGENNECANFIVRPTSDDLIFNAEKSRNATGYSLLGNYYFNNIKETGLNTSARYDFEDTVPSLSCFRAQESGYPIRNSSCIFDKNINDDNLVRDPISGGSNYPASGKAYLRVFPRQAISPQASGAYIVLPEKGDYYLSFLVNTLNSNTEARVILIDFENYLGNKTEYLAQDLIKVIATTSPVWKRVIQEFTTTKDNTKLRIYLSANNSGSNNGPVYFDDVNIETVLKISDNKYIARDCRLYPNSSSLACQDVDNNATSHTITRNGLEGYCLEYDLANPSVCQLWMPIDRIASSKISSNELGYQGKYPLSYCAEVSSNFLFLEKRVATIVEETSEFRTEKHFGFRECFYPGKSLGFCRAMFLADYEITVDIPQTGAIGGVTASTDLEFNFKYDPNNLSDNPEITAKGTQDVEAKKREKTPKEDLKKGKSCVTEDGTDGIANEDGGTCEDYYILTAKVGDHANSDLVNEYCGDSGHYFLLQMSDLKRERSGKDELAKTSICVPIDNYGYYSDGSIATYRYVPSEIKPITVFSGVNTFRPVTDGWYYSQGFDSRDGQAAENKRSGNPAGFDELYNADPPLRVIDLNYPIPAGESDLKKISSNNPDEVFRLTCNKFIEAVSGNGTNMAWAQRISQGSDYKIGYELKNGNQEIQRINGIVYNNYVRKLGDIPFGAASWPDSFNLANSSRVKFYNQYSAKNNENIFAGRPYGCEINPYNPQSEANCARIGYCSANPDVYCLVKDNLFNENTYDIGRHSCGAWGECFPLWSFDNDKDKIKNLKTSAFDALRSIFRQAPVAYEFKTGEEGSGYVSVPGYFANSDSVSAPQIINPKLYYNKTMLEISDNLGFKAGNYRLEFNINVNPNAQPLKEIFIDWGDGFKQVITGEDAKNSSAGQKHSIYHFYSGISTSVAPEIKIKAYDNWGVFGEASLAR